MKKIQIMVAVFCIAFTMGIAIDVNAASIGNTVWNDYNKNGIQDEDEGGISGVRVKLYNGNDVETDKTNSKGRYEFDDLDAGHYTLIVAQETLPEGCYNTYDRDGNEDGMYEDKYLKEDDVYTHADFGYYCATVAYAQTGTVSPQTGVSTAVAIMALALAAGMGMFVYKRQNKNNALKK